MPEAAREQILKRLRTHSALPHNLSELGDRRIGDDRRVRSMQVPIERRSGVERRIGTQQIRYLQLRDISWQPIPE